MLATFRKASLKNASYLEVMQTLSDRFASLNAVTHRDFAAARTALANAVQKLDLDFKQQAGSDLTAEISAQDELRDKAYTAFAAIVRVQSEAGVADAVRLHKIVTKYNINVRAQMDEETSLIKQLAQEVAALGSTVLTRLGVAEHWQAVTAHTATLSGLLTRRDDERATLQLGLVKADRAAIDSAYDRLEAIINAALVYEPSQALTDGVAQLNSYLNRVRTQMLSQSASESEEVSGQQPSGDVTPSDQGSTPSGGSGSAGGSTGSGSASGNEGDEPEFDA